MHEWPLIAFTILVQASVGTTVFATVILIYANNRLDVKEKCRLLLLPMMLAFIAGALGLVASTAHLGYPLNAFHALMHFGSSWLSREIIFASLYLAVLGLAILIAILKKQVSSLLLPIAALLGIVDIFCMSAIYVHASVVTWMHFNTYLMFYGSALSLGAIVCLWALAVRPGLPAQWMKRIALTMVIVVIATTLLRLLEQPLFMAFLTQAGQSDVVTFPHQPLTAFEQLSGLRLTSWLMLVVGACALALSLRSQQSKNKMLVLGGGLIVVAEVLLRFSFFSIY